MSSSLDKIICPIKQNYSVPFTDSYILVDRDNTIIVDAGYTFEMSELRFIPEAIAVLRRLQFTKRNIVVISNQGGIGLEKYSIEEMLTFNDFMVKELEFQGVTISAIYSCPHHPLSQNQSFRYCENRKPASGMIQAFLSDFDATANQCIMIGDSKTDVQAANESGIEGFLVKNPSDWNSIKVDTL